MSKEKYFEYEDEVVVKKGKFKGMFGIVRQKMPNGLYGVTLKSGRHIYFERKNLLKLPKKKKRKYPYGKFNFKTKKLIYTHKLKKVGMMGDLP